VISAGPRQHQQAGGGIVAQLPFLVGRGQQDLGPLHGELVGRQVVGHGGLVVAPLDVGPELAHPGHDLASLGVVTDGDGVDGLGVDGLEPLADHGLEPGLTVAEVEAGQPGERLLLARRDAVEVVFHTGGEGVVDQIGEMNLEQADHSEGGERRHEGGALLPDVAAVLDGGDDRGVGGRSADAHLLEGLDERRLGVAGRRLGGVVLDLEPVDVEDIAGGEGGQAHLAVLQIALRVVGPLHVGPQEPGELDDLARGRELGVLPGRARGRGAQAHLHAPAPGVGHLGGDRALPDQVVQCPLVGPELRRHLVGGAEAVTGGPDGLVGTADSDSDVLSVRM